MSADFSKLDKAKLDLIRMKNKLDDLRDMTLRDYEEIDYLEKLIGHKIVSIRDLQQTHDNDPVEIMRRDMHQAQDTTGIDIRELM